MVSRNFVQNLAALSIKDLLSVLSPNTRFAQLYKTSLRHSVFHNATNVIFTALQTLTHLLSASYNATNLPSPTVHLSQRYTFCHLLSGSINSTNLHSLTVCLSQISKFTPTYPVFHDVTNHHLLIVCSWQRYKYSPMACQEVTSPLLPTVCPATTRQTVSHSL